MEIASSNIYQYYSWGESGSRTFATRESRERFQCSRPILITASNDARKKIMHLIIFTYFCCFGYSQLRDCFYPSFWFQFEWNELFFLKKKYIH